MTRPIHGDNLRALPELSAPGCPRETPGTTCVADCPGHCRTLPTDADRLSTLERLVELQSARLVQFVDARRKALAAIGNGDPDAARKALAETERLDGAPLANIFRRAAKSTLCSEPTQGPSGAAYNNGARESLSVMAHLLASSPTEALELCGVIAEPVRHELVGKGGARA